MSVDDRTAAGAATLVAGGTALAALPFVAVLVGVTPPAWSAFGRRVGRFVAAAGLVVVATWVARERDGPAGFTALVAAAGTLLLALLAGVLSATGVGAFGRRGAAAMALIAGGVCFLAVGLAAGDRRLRALRAGGVERRGRGLRDRAGARIGYGCGGT